MYETQRNPSLWLIFAGLVCLAAHVVAGESPVPPIEEAPPARHAVAAPSAPGRRTLPAFQAPTAPAALDAQTPDAVAASGVLLDEVLLPTQAGPADAATGLAVALTTYTQVLPGQRDLGILRSYLAAQPESPYAGALLLNIGFEAARQGYFPIAAQSYQQAWERLQAAATPKLRALADRALVEWLSVLAWAGDFEQIDLQLPIAQARGMAGASERRLHAVLAWRGMMRQMPAEGSLCGPYAVSALVKLNQPQSRHGEVDQAMRRVLAGVISAYGGGGARGPRRRGANLHEVKAVADGMAESLQIAKSAGATDVPVPSIVHWKQNHFSAVVERDGDRYRIDDPAMAWFGARGTWITRAALVASTSGYALVPAGRLPQGWQSASPEESADIWGRGIASGPPTDSPIGGAGTCPGMPEWSFSWTHVSLCIDDTPLFYAPAAGPAVAFHVRYSEADKSQPSVPVFSNLGPKWIHRWHSTVTITQSTTNSMTAIVGMPGGGEITQSMYRIPNTQRFVGGYEIMRNQAALQFVEAGTGYSAPSSAWLYPLFSAIREVGFGLSIDMSNQTAAYVGSDGSSLQYIARPPAGGGAPTLFYMTSSKEPNGLGLQYAYDAQYRLMAVTDALGQVTTLGYEDATDQLKITKVTDPFGRTAHVAYDAGRVSGITDMIGLTSTVTYDSPTGDVVASLVRPYGTISYSRGGSGYIHWIESVDAQGDRQRMEANGHTEGLNNGVAPLVMPTGTRILVSNTGITQWANTFFWGKKAMKLGYGGDRTKAEIKAYGYEGGPASYMLMAEKSALSDWAYYIYPGQTAWGYDSGVTGGAPEEVARVLQDGSTQIRKYTWSNTGKLLMAQDPLGRQTYFTYAANGIDLANVYQGTVGMPVQDRSFLASFGYDTAHNITSVTDASGRTTSLSYNGLSQLTDTVLPQRSGQPVEQIHLNYHATTKQLTGIVDQAGTTTSVAFDPKGRLQSVTSIDGYTVTMQYDDLDRLVQSAYPDGTYEQIGYDKLDPTWFRDREGRWTRAWYNLNRKPVAVRDPQGQTTTFDWCRCGSLKRITDPQGRVTIWDYDADGRLLKKVFPDGRMASYAYEPRSGRLLSVTDAKGQVATFSYYGDDRIAGIAYSNAAVPTPSISMGYDGLLGRLTSMGDGTGSTAFNYTPFSTTPPVPTTGLGRLASIDGPLANDTITLGYDEQGRVVSSSLNGAATSWTLDKLGRMTGLTNPLGSAVLQYVGNTGRLDRVTAANGVISQFAYLGANQDLRLQSILHSKGGARITENAYTYTPTGQIASWTQQYGTSTLQAWVPAYDNTDQMTGVDIHSGSVGGAVSQALSYVYDAGGNRLSTTVRQGSNLSVLSAAFNTVNQLTQLGGAGGKMRVRGHLDEPGTVKVQGADVPVKADKSFTTVLDAPAGTSSFSVQATDLRGNSITKNYQVTAGTAGTTRDFTYDLNGNCTSDGLRTYAWDAADRLVTITQGTSVTTITYDGMGRRARVVDVVGGTTTADRTFVWVGAAIAEERNGAGTTVARYCGNGMQIITGPKAGLYTYARDHLGSIQAITDASGAVRAQYAYTPWGERTKLSGDVDTDEGFTGHWHHTSGLVLTWFRAYDPATGRWLSRDPIGERGGLNLYGYCVNNPINSFDPYGQNPPDEDEPPPGVDLQAWIAFQREEEERHKNAAGGCGSGGRGGGRIRSPPRWFDFGGLFRPQIKAIQKAGNKGVNIHVPTQKAAEYIIEQARPNIPWRETYGPPNKAGKEVHDVDGSGNAPGKNFETPHIKWYDWTEGKANGSYGHIYFDTPSGGYPPKPPPNGGK